MQTKSIAIPYSDENLVRYGSTKGKETQAATFNPFADLKAKMEGKNLLVDVK